MTVDQIELARREKRALESIKRSLEFEAGVFGATLFASHHIEELDSSYCKNHAGTDDPKPAQVLELLCMQSHWGDDDEDGIETLDFGLPGDASSYLISVRFDEEGAVDEISMES